MKNIFLTFAVTIISSFALSYNASAKYDLGINDEDKPDLSRPIIINLTEDSATNDNSKNINERAVKNFQKEFPHTINPSWYKDSDGFVASFRENSKLTRVAYDKKGGLDHSISYYGEEMLPTDVRHIVKSAYYDYSILSVAEINVNKPDAQTIYIVNIQGQNDWMKLTVSNFEILKIEKFNRS